MPLSDLLDLVTQKLRRDLYVTVGLASPWGLDLSTAHTLVGDHLHLQVGPMRVLATLLRPGAFVVQYRNPCGHLGPFSPASFTSSEPRLPN